MPELPELEVVCEVQYFTNLMRSRKEREENHLHLRGFAPLREAKS